MLVALAPNDVVETLAAARRAEVSSEPFHDASRSTPGSERRMTNPALDSALANTCVVVAPPDTLAIITYIVTMHHIKP